MRTSLFDRVPYDEIARRRGAVYGVVRAGDCDRLRGLVDDDGRIEMSVTAAVAARGVQLSGHVSGEVTLTCRRCLGPVAWRFRRPVSLLVVGSEADMCALADDVEAHHAPALAGRPLDVLQEEVLLAMPDHPEHAPGECAAPAAGVDVEDEEQAAARRRQAEVQRPFDALEVLKKRSDGDSNSE
jgi:uncharacterized protein